MWRHVSWVIPLERNPPPWVIPSYQSYTPSSSNACDQVNEDVVRAGD